MLRAGELVRFCSEQFAGVELGEVARVGSWLEEKCGRLNGDFATVEWSHTERLLPDGSWCMVMGGDEAPKPQTPSETDAAVRGHMSRPWTRVALPAVDGSGYIAFVDEARQRCQSTGETEGDALTGLDAALYDWLWELVRSGEPVPEPLLAQSSGECAELSAAANADTNSDASSDGTAADEFGLDAHSLLARLASYSPGSTK